MGFNSLNWLNAFVRYTQTHTFNSVDAGAAILRTLKQYVHRIWWHTKKRIQFQATITCFEALMIKWAWFRMSSWVVSFFVCVLFHKIYCVVTRSIWTEVRKSNCSIALMSLFCWVVLFSSDWKRNYARVFVVVVFSCKIIPHWNGFGF